MAIDRINRIDRMFFLIPSRMEGINSNPPSAEGGFRLFFGKVKNNIPSILLILSKKRC